MFFSPSPCLISDRSRSNSSELLRRLRLPLSRSESFAVINAEVNFASAWMKASVPYREPNTNDVADAHATNMAAVEIFIWAYNVAITGGF